MTILQIEAIAIVATLALLAAVAAGIVPTRRSGGDAPLMGRATSA
jgi:hypothetical protein